MQHRPDAASGESAHYRQLSLRNPAHHHRQISTPATSQNYYGTGQRPVSSYYEYENAAHPKNGADNANMVNFRKALMNQQHQQQQQQQSGYGQVNYRNHNNNETLYGIVGQQVNKRPSLGPPGQAGTLSAQQQQQNILRQQQPIYQSNQVQIYGSSVYNTLPNQQQPIYGRLPPQGNRSGGLYGSFPRNDIYATNGLPNAYQTKG